jgi:hypothetical protein
MLLLYFTLLYCTLSFHNYIILKLEKTIRGNHRSETDIKVTLGLMVWARVTDDS